LKTRLLILIALLSVSLLSAAQDKTWKPSAFEGMKFEEFVSSVEQALGVTFYYNEDWTKELVLGKYPDNYTLSNILDVLFRNRSVYYFIDRFGDVILSRSYRIKTPGKPASGESEFLPPTGYAPKDDNQKISGSSITEVGSPSEKNEKGSVTISGYITNHDTRDPIAGVTVYVQKLAAGTISNGYGYYAITLPRGLHTLQFSFVGMKEKKITLNLYGTGELNVEMNSTLIPIKETVVSAQKNVTLQRFEVGAEKINIASLKLLPTSLGVKDIIKSILLIPGVQSVGEGSTGFNVRGGSADQNLILLYGAPVYNSSHFFGFFSAVNSEIIRDATLYKGGIPSRYGGRISSVLDIGTNEGNKRKFSGEAGISPVTTDMYVQGPIKKDTLSYLLAARTTYSNWLFSVINNPSLKNSRVAFYDLNGSMSWDIDKKNRIDLSAYYSHDGFRFNADTMYSYDNGIFALKWRHNFTGRFISLVSVNNSYYNYNISSANIPTEAFNLSHRINSTGLRADFNWFAGKHEINFGMDANRYRVMPGSYKPLGDSSLVNPEILQTERALETALYFEDKYPLTDHISINAGLRFSGFAAVGPQTIYIYKPGFTRSASTITDTLHISAGQVSRFYGGPEFRISLNFRISNSSSLKLNYNRTRQYLHLLSNSASIAPSDTWKLSGYSLRPQTGDQAAVGLYRVIAKHGMETSLEIYYKTIGNMPDFKGGANLVMNRRVEEEMVDVKGKAYGAELTIRKTEGKLRYFIGYTYSRTFIRSTSSLREEIINSGKWFPANYDKPHDLIVSFNYFISRRYSLSSSYTYSTGRPITFPVATYVLYDNTMIHYSDRNEYRIPDYSRLDFSFRISGSLRAKKLFRPNLILSVYNVLGRKNVYSVYFRKEGDLIKGYKLSVFGEAIPSATLSFDF